VSRLDAVKEIVRRFVLGGEGLGGRPDDLIGMVQFARYADATCPLTLDHLNLAAILDQIEIAREPAEDGTAVGEGLALGVERLRRHPAKSKVIVLLTDGVNNAGEIDPLHAAELAAAHDIRVYAVGAGQTGLAPVPVQAPDGRVFLRRAHVELDEKTLRAIAQRADGRYFHARNSEMLSDVYAEIDRLERTRVSEVRYMQYREHYAGWTLGALACVAVAGLAAATILRRLP
jgi:Ca-activated chloride channel family protein